MLSQRFIMILLASAYCMACNTSNTNVSKMYKDDKLHLQIQYPANWSFDSSNYTIRQELESDTDTYQEKILIGYEVMPMKIEPKMYADGIAMQFKLLDTTLLQKSFVDFINSDFKCYKIVFEKQAPDVSKTIQYVLVKDTFAYSLQCNTTVANFANQEPSFDSIIHNIRFIK